MSQVSIIQPMTVDLPLDKNRRFRFTAFECTRACRVLNQLGYQVFQQPVNSGTLLVLLGADSYNLDPLAAVISAGLLDTQDHLVNSHEKIMRILSDMVANGQSLQPVMDAIGEAGKRSHIFRERTTPDDGAKPDESAEGNDGMAYRNS